jgi:STE24 endopeptidase
VNQDKSARYHALKRRAAILSVSWSAGFLIVFAATPLSSRLAAAAGSLAAAAGVPSNFLDAAVVAAYVAMFGVLHELGSLPIAFYRGFLLEHRYQLSNETIGGWLRDQAKSALLGGVLSIAGFSLLYLAIRRWPDTWWLAAAGGMVVFVTVMARLAPVLLLPIFFRLKPLSRQDLRQRLVDLSTRAGVPATDALEWRLSDRTKKGNAALAGLGRTRRILVSDTLLAGYPDDEIEVILAHELAHHAHHDIWKGIAAETLVAACGFFLASRVLALLAPRLGWSSVADVAGLPVLLLTAGCLSMLLLPAANAFSRSLERAADRFAIEITANPAAFARAMQRLGAQNLAEEEPSRVARWLFYSHPPFGERIAAARKFEQDG